MFLLVRYTYHLLPIQPVMLIPAALTLPLLSITSSLFVLVLAEHLLSYHRPSAFVIHYTIAATYFTLFHRAGPRFSDFAYYVLDALLFWQLYRTLPQHQLYPAPHPSARAIAARAGQSLTLAASCTLLYVR